MSARDHPMNVALRRSAGIPTGPPRDDKGRFIPATAMEALADAHGARDPKLIARLMQFDEDGSDDEARLQRLKEEHADLFHSDTTTASTGAPTGAQAMNAAIRGARGAQLLETDSREDKSSNR